MAYQFMLKKKSGKSDAFIYLRYSYQESECLISTGKKIEIKHWDEEKGKPKNSYPGGKGTLDRNLTTIKGAVMKAATELENDEELPLPEAVKKRYTESKSGIVRGATKAVTLWEQFIKDGEGKKTPHTIVNENQSLDTFNTFLESIKKPALTLRQITKELITAYEKFLSTYADNTRAKKLKHFKAFLKSVNHPCVDLVKFKEYAGDMIHLTEEELTAIENYSLKPGTMMAAARDLLCLQCETGLRVSDLKRIDRGNIQGSSLTIRALKNDKDIDIPISPIIAEIIRRYNHDIPRIADQTYNSIMKDIAKLAIPESMVELTERRGGKKDKKTCFKWEVLSSHACVRTFINLAAARGMPLVSIAALTGKTVATLLKSYLKPNVEQAYKDAITYARVPMVVNK